MAKLVSYRNRSVTRKIDELGRIVLPIDMRKTIGMVPGDDVEITCEDSVITLRKLTPSCVFCGDRNELYQISLGYVCPKCAAKIAEELSAD